MLPHRASGEGRAVRPRRGMGGSVPTWCRSLRDGLLVQTLGDRLLHRCPAGLCTQQERGQEGDLHPPGFPPRPGRHRCEPRGSRYALWLGRRAGAPGVGSRLKEEELPGAERGMPWKVQPERQEWGPGCDMERPSATGTSRAVGMCPAIPGRGEDQLCRTG